MTSNQIVKFRVGRLLYNSIRCNYHTQSVYAMKWPITCSAVPLHGLAWHQTSLLDSNVVGNDVAWTDELTTMSWEGQLVIVALWASDGLFSSLMRSRFSVARSPQCKLSCRYCLSYLMLIHTKTTTYHKKRVSGVIPPKEYPAWYQKMKLATTFLRVCACMLVTTTLAEYDCARQPRQL